ncbi:MAG: ParB/RepB/Spo0J family partition protein [Thermoguttaceae bacterium]|nr:ParB/RepB/Spo0J family partition protein [Thermoguttaceae bacterium]MDW8077806.1 ParB/RepB/Spo0J family partition protein [Thermoguttaceae bacterium]
MAKERRLGRGLEALLGRISDVESVGGQLGDHLAPASWTGPSPQAGPGIGNGGGVEMARAEGHVATFHPALSLEPNAFVEQPVSSGDGQFGQAASPETGTVPEPRPAGTHRQSQLVKLSPEEMPGSSEAGTRLVEIEISQIESNPFQPRGEFPPAEIQALADSLRAHGLLQPVLVRRHGAKYQLVAGERRLRAAVQAGWTRVPAQIIDADDRQLAELALVENIHRKDLNPLEKAASFQRYLREFGGTQEQLASRLKMDRSTIANLIRLLELPAPVQQALRDGRITQGHARALLALDDERTQIAFCERIQREGWSVRQTEAMVSKALEEQSRQEEGEEVSLRVLSAEPPPRPSRSQSQHIAALEREFRLALGTNVQIIHNRRGRGRLIIHFRTHEEFERIRRLICESAAVPQARAS